MAKFSKTKFCISALVTLASAPPMLAATDGFFGFESSASFDVSMQLAAAPAAMIKISGLSDVSFTKTVGDAQLTPEIRDACVHMDQPGTYSITITAEPLTSSDGRSYPYQVVVSETTSDFETTLDVTDETEIANGDGLIPSSSSNCGDTDTLDLVISEEGDLTEAFSATTTITLLVTPE